MTLTSIIIATFNQLPYTKLCLKSIFRHTQTPFEIIIVDNGSTDGTLQYLAQQKVKLISNTTNRGFPAAANQGIAASTGQFIVLLNNDVIVTNGWLDRLLNALRDRPELGLAGPCSNNVSGPQQIEVTYRELTDLDSFAADHAARFAHRLLGVERLVGFCLMFRREVIDRIGLLDERFGIGNFEDDDFCRRALAAGFNAAIVRDAFIHHFGHTSFKAAGVDLPALLQKNESIFKEKWSATSPNPKSAIQNPKSNTISLCMIVRDSSKTLPACLTSIKPWVDEIIVVDTGSADDTRQIAASFGAKVFDFPWPDSFAAARNESLRHATGGWIFWMDSDDTIDTENGKKLLELPQAASPTTMGFVMQVHCPAESSLSPSPGTPGEGRGEGSAQSTPTSQKLSPSSASFIEITSTGEGFSQSPKPDPYATATVVDHIKLFRNLPELRFTGRIHEQIIPAIRRLGGEVQWADAFVTHSGSDSTPEGRARKQKRDLRLLELELNDDPDSTFALFNLGMTLLDAHLPEEALNVLCRSLQLSSPAESHVRKIYALLVEAYKQLNRPETALKTCIQGLTSFSDDPELLFRKALLEQSLGKLPEAQQSLLHLLNPQSSSDPSPPLAVSQTNNATRRHFSSIDHGIVGIKAWRQLAIIQQSLGQHETAAASWRRVLDFNRNNPDAWLGLIDALCQNKSFSAVARIADGDEKDVPPNTRAIAHARLLTQNGKPTEAIALLERTMSERDSDEILEELCRLSFTADQLEPAHRWLTELSLRRPSDPSALQNLGAILLRRGEFLKAAQCLKQSLKIRPNYPAAMELLQAAQKQQN